MGPVDRCRPARRCRNSRLNGRSPGDGRLDRLAGTAAGRRDGSFEVGRRRPAVARRGPARAGGRSPRTSSSSPVSMSHSQKPVSDAASISSSRASRASTASDRVAASSRASARRSRDTRRERTSTTRPTAMTPYRICRQISTRSTSVTPPSEVEEDDRVEDEGDDDGGHAGDEAADPRGGDDRGDQQDVAGVPADRLGQGGLQEDRAPAQERTGDDGRRRLEPDVPSAFELGLGAAGRRSFQVPRFHAAAPPSSARAIGRAQYRKPRHGRQSCRALAAAMTLLGRRQALTCCRACRPYARRAVGRQRPSPGPSTGFGERGVTR